MRDEKTPIFISSTYGSLKLKGNVLDAAKVCKAIFNLQLSLSKAAGNLFEDSKWI